MSTGFVSGNYSAVLPYYGQRRTHGERTDGPPHQGRGARDARDDPRCRREGLPREGRRARLAGGDRAVRGLHARRDLLALQGQGRALRRDDGARGAAGGGDARPRRRQAGATDPLVDPAPGHRRGAAAHRARSAPAARLRHRVPQVRIRGRRRRCARSPHREPAGMHGDHRGGLPRLRRAGLPAAEREPQGGRHRRPLARLRASSPTGCSIRRASRSRATPSRWWTPTSAGSSPRPRARRR